MGFTDAVDLLVASGISMSFGSPEIEILRPTDFIVSSGDYVSITGPSGSGKSSLLNILGLLEPPTRGTYMVSGIETTEASKLDLLALRARLFGFVFQQFHLLPGRTTLENVELGALYTHPRGAARRKEAKERLDMLGLGHRIHADPRTLSGGEKQRTAIARALMGNPAVLLCDEPTGNLDSENSAKTVQLLEALNQEGIALVIVTHDPAMAARARRHVEILDGTVRESAIVSEVGT